MLRWEVWSYESRLSLTLIKIMVEMGFEYDPSTAGSSVRFIPKDQRDKPITFHKRMSGYTPI